MGDLANLEGFDTLSKYGYFGRLLFSYQLSAVTAVLYLTSQ